MNRIAQSLVEKIHSKISITDFGSINVDTAKAISLSIEEEIKRNASITERRNIFNRYKKFLTEIASIIGMNGYFCRLHRLGAIEDIEDIEAFVSHPYLDGSLSKNLSSEVEYEDILYDPEIYDIIMPVIVIYGSRLKGYSSLASDIDIAVFVRPEIGGRDISKVLKRKFKTNITEYRLEEIGGKNFEIYNSDKSHVADDNNISILLNGVWEGDMAAIAMLKTKLLKPMLDNCNQEMRYMWMRDMERDLLQYRLLHNGYSLYEPCNKNVYWDEGYRITASKLYAGHVIIP